ncbi:B3 domain-containing transcription factor LEC2-like isoform X2 [Magnolia sinica]|uniref:B3 domain-containing transcription factor LEC2-like isoform X2 n=1 Tax=Magnolia sinica TaxID=86752 RepID=UPI00265A94EB|nr:B3 domain-containing transcription factor LEC2-like isoform X2 [Magnolia sinica]
MATGKITLNQDVENNMELDFQLHHPFISPPPFHHLQNLPQQQPQQPQNSQFYPVLPADYHSIFPVFPILVEPFPMDLNFFDGFFPDIGAGLVQEPVTVLPPSVAVMSPPPVLVQPPRQCAAPSVTRAARNKRKVVRQRGSGSSRAGSYVNPTVQNPPPTVSFDEADGGEFITHPFDANRKLKFVLQKELRKSDVNSLGRIVLPKRDVEENLPYLSFKEGIHLTALDLFSHDTWFVRYRFWPNNGSRMYVLENTAEFVEQNDLRIGDMVTIYQDESRQLYILGTKVENPQALPPIMEPRTRKREREQEQMVTQVGMMVNDKSKPKTYTVGESSSNNTATIAATTPAEMSLSVTKCSSPNNNDTMGEEFLFLNNSPLVDLDEFDFSQLECLTGFDDYDLTMYDDFFDEQKIENSGKNVVENPAL